MKLRFPEKEILQWASEYDYPVEELTVDFIAIVKRQKHLNLDQLKRVAKWKSPRSAGHVVKNENTFVQEITNISLLAKEERTRLEVLTLLDGVDYPTASVILHFFHPEPYPILDFRALWSLGEEKSGQYDWRLWMKYFEKCRELADRNKVDMRTLDKALWAYSKSKQNK